MRLPTSSSLNVGPRLIPLISEHPPTGIFSDNVQKLYLEKYNERLPQNWLQLASQSGIRIEYAANEKFILTYSPVRNTKFLFLDQWSINCVPIPALNFLCYFSF